jgi:hypothetical protein
MTPMSANMLTAPADAENAPNAPNPTQLDGNAKELAGKRKGMRDMA